MSLAGVAKANLIIYEHGIYELASGQRIDLSEEIRSAIEGTVLYRPEDDLLSDPREGAPRIEVTEEKTGAAGRRLVEKERCERVAVLNFASAKNPGGGFLRGAKAQEEDLARCSALYACLITKREYYNANRNFPSLLYSDHIVYAPGVPFFRDEQNNLLERPFLLSVITAPAPNAGEVLRRKRNAGPAIQETLERRAGKVLAIAEANGNRNLVLGAWGCGVFRNEPSAVADVFARWLESDRFAGAFDRVVFAVYDRSRKKATLGAFQERLGGA